MNAPKVFESEYKFCLLLWANEPMKSTELAKLCEKELGWKKVPPTPSSRDFPNEASSKVKMPSLLLSFQRRRFRQPRLTR